MGGGSWTKASYKTYADTRGVSLSFDGSLNVDKSYSAQEMFKQREIAASRNRFKIPKTGTKSGTGLRNQ